jgi:hypothetical protein
LSTDHIPRKSANLIDSPPTAVATPGVEAIINRVKSDAASTAWATGAECRENADRGIPLSRCGFDRASCGG